MRLGALLCALYRALCTAAHLLGVPPLAQRCAVTCIRCSSFLPLAAGHGFSPAFSAADEPSAARLRLLLPASAVASALTAERACMEPYLPPLRCCYNAVSTHLPYTRLRGFGL